MTTAQKILLMLLLYTGLNLEGISQTATNLNAFYRWEHITVSEGLPSPVVNCITQDSTGFMWFGTPDGLVRYDGFHLVVFTHLPDDSTSLSDNDITALMPDTSGMLWVGTTHGLNLLDPYTGRVKRYMKRTGDTTSLPNDHIRALLFDSHHRYWVESVSGWLSLFDPASGKARSYHHMPVYQHYYRYHQIYEASDGMIWIAGRNLPPLKFDPVNEKMTSFPTTRTDSRYKREQDGACYFEDASGNLLIGALDGIYIIDRNNGTVKKIHPNTTHAMISDGQGNIWAATGWGIFHHYADGRPPDEITHDPDIPWSLINNHVNTLFRDASGCLWAGTGGGVSKWAPARHKFRCYTHITSIKNSLSFPRVNVMVADSQSLWIGTDGSGIDRFDPATSRFTHFSPDNTPGMKGGRVSALWLDSHRALWAGLWNGTGFGNLDTAHHRFNLFSFDPKTQIFDWYNDFTEDEAGNFYIGFWGADGLAWFDRAKKKFTRTFYFHRTDKVVSRLTTDLFRDRIGKIWIGTSDNGFSIYNPWSDRMQNFPAESGGFPEEGVNVFFEDSQGRMWIGAKNLYRFYQATQQFINISAWYHLPAKTIFAITEDNRQMLWLNTDRGLIRFNPADYTYTQFTENDGLQSDLFTKAACRLPDGRIAAGGAKGFNLFDPATVVPWHFVPRIAITGLTINGEEYTGGHPAGRLLRLSHNENFITLSLAVFDYNNPRNTRIRYQLKGFNNQPVEIGGGVHEAVFTNIPPGEYTLVLQPTNADGWWAPDITSYRMKINEPWWNTWWFRSLLITLIGSSIFWLMKNRNEKIRIREESLELQHKLLRSRMNPHFIFNSLFAIQNFIYSSSPDVAGRYLSDFALLMRRILDQSAEDFIPLEQEIKTLQLYLRLQMMRFPGKFSTQVMLDENADISEVSIPPMIIQPFVENSIEHGIKNRTDGQVDIEFRLTPQTLTVSVADNGTGMPAHADETNATDNKRTHALQITRDRIALLNTKFRIQILLSIRQTHPDDTEFPGTTIELIIPSHPKTFKP